MDAPDFVQGTDLADRLRAYAPLLSSNGGDGCRLTIPSATADALNEVLATAQAWAQHWQLPEVTVRVDRRPYTLGSRPKPRAEERPKLVFFYSPRSGQCRRAEALVAQVLQRRHNHETFELVRISVDARPELAEHFGVEEVPAVVVLEGRQVAARLVAPHHSYEIEAALRPWLR